MQSTRKHRKPKKERVNAAEYAKAYTASVGSKDKAILNVKHLASVSKAKSTDSTLSADEQKHYLQLSHFWENVGGHIAKLELRQ